MDGKGVPEYFFFFGSKQKAFYLQLFHVIIFIFLFLHINTLTPFLHTILILERNVLCIPQPCILTLSEMFQGELIFRLCCTVLQEKVVGFWDTYLQNLYILCLLYMTVHAECYQSTDLIWCKCINDSSFSNVHIISCLLNAIPIISRVYFIFLYCYENQFIL